MVFYSLKLSKSPCRLIIWPFWPFKAINTYTWWFPLISVISRFCFQDRILVLIVKFLAIAYI